MDMNTEPVITDGYAIRRTRKLRGWSARALAKKVDLSAAQISRIENGLSQGSPEALRAIARALRVGMLEITKENARGGK